MSRNPTIHTNKGMTINGITLIFLFLASLNTINRYYYFIFIAFAIFLLRPRRKFRFDAYLVPLFILAISWAIFAPASMISVFGPIKPFTYALCYLMGFSFFDDERVQSNNMISYKSFYWFVGIISAGPFVHYIFNWIKNGNADERNTVDLWTNSVMAATGQAALACLPLALAVACLFMKSNKGLKFLAFASLVLIVMYNLVLAGRTLIALLLIAVVGALVHQLCEMKRGKLRLILSLLIIIVLIAFIYQINLLGVRDYIESSLLYDRFFGEHAMDLDEDGRLEKKIYYLKNMFAHPFGGANMREQMGYAHDIYLDTYDEAGIFAFAAILIYIVASLIRMIKCVKDKTLPFQFRQVVFCVYLLLYIEFMVEPILQGMPWLFASFCLIDGYVARILSEKRKKKRREIKV